MIDAERKFVVVAIRCSVCCWTLIISPCSYSFDDHTIRRDEFIQLMGDLMILAIQEGDGTMLDSMLFTLGSGLSSGKTHVYSDLPIDRYADHTGVVPLS